MDNHPELSEDGDEQKKQRRVFHRMRLAALHNGNLLDREFDKIFGWDCWGPLDLSFTEEPYRGWHEDKSSLNGHTERRKLSMSGHNGDKLSRKRRRLTKRKFLRKISWAK